MFKFFCYPSAILSALICSACADPTFAFRVNNEFREHGPILIHSYSGENRLNGKPGFMISMRPEYAKDLQAPNSKEFQKILNEKIILEEQAAGHKLCPLGYDFVDAHTMNYHGMYINYDAACRE
jgi:hypothetical protein